MKSRIPGSELWRQLLVAAIAFGVAAAVRQGVYAVSGIYLQYLTFFPAVIAATLFGGVPAGLFTALAAGVGAVHWSRPTNLVPPSTIEDLIILGLFLLTSVFIIGMGWVVNHARRASEQAQLRLAVRHAITRVLVESSTVEDAVPRVIQATCDTLGWAFGALWLVDKERGALRCEETWKQAGGEYDEFEEQTRLRTFAPGIGLPGRIWATNYAAWIPDVVQDNNFPRGAVAAEAGLHAAFGIPISLEGSVVGVLEFFSNEIQQPDPDLLQTMAGLGNQLGQFINRKRAENALRASESRKAAILETALDAIISIDHHGRILEFNPSAQRLFGYTHEQAIGQLLAELIIPETLRARHAQGMAHYLATGEGPVLNRRIELTALRAGGIEFPVELTITRLSGDGPPVFTSYIRDISSQKEAAQAIEESERRFGRFMQHLPGLAWSKDLEGRYRFANDAALKAFRKTMADLYGHKDEDIFPAETAALFRENDRRALAGEVGIQTVETLLNEDGTLHSSIVSKFPIPGPDGKPALVGGIAIDITERMQMEESLKQADRRKDEFLATLAHELRNPLAPISNALHILRLSGELPPAANRVREIMEKQVNHLVRLVDDLLEVSRVTRGKIELRKEAVEMASVIESAVDTSRPLIEAAGHQLAISISPETMTVEADPVRLVQVISNLLNNAAKYTENGGQIWLTARPDGDQILISVRDSGIGIPAEMLPQVFDMFSQIDRSTKRSQGGLGIGLTLVKNLVQMHGGQIEARSEGAGKGSEFVVRLPVAAAHHSAGTPAGATGKRAALPTRKILAVDDTQAAVFILGRLLETLGQLVTTANSAAAALEIVRASRPDVVISDIAMPQMDGYELARRLRQEPGLEGLVLIALTGYGQHADRQRALEAGFDFHLVKPVSLEGLQELLASLPVRQGTPLTRS